MTFPFADQPFATNIIQPFTRTVANVFTSAPIDVSQFQGARFSFINEGGASVVNITLTYYDDQAQALAPTAFNNSGFRQVVVNTSDSAEFTIPHLADWLVINFASQDAGNFALNWSVAHRQNGIQQWMPGSPFLFGPFTSNSLASNGNQTITTPSAGRYAGPATAFFATNSVNVGSVWQLFALDTSGTRQLIAQNSCIGGRDTLQDEVAVYHVSAHDDVGISLHIPPLPLSVTVINQTGSAGVIISGVIIADDWRAA